MKNRRCDHKMPEKGTGNGRKNVRTAGSILAAALCLCLMTGCEMGFWSEALRTAESLSGALGNKNGQAGILTEEAVDTGICYEAEMPVDGLAYGTAAMAMPAANGVTGSGFGIPQEGQIDWNTEEYRYVPENRWVSAAASPFSTFAADVDTASYANVRRMLLRGERVPEDAVRIEEMINYFTYDYPEPAGEEPFSVTTELAPCPWNEETQLLLIGLQARKPETGKLPKSNLVFLIDVSGSMDWYNKLPLVQRAFRMLAENLDEEDRISVVTYATEDRVVLDGLQGSEQSRIVEAIEDLMAGGGTNGSAGIQTAYELAEKHFIEGGSNRVILATDGDLNIGITDEGSLTRLIEEKAGSGVYLSVLGFGEGNLSDARMEALADHGNGNYHYIDDIAEARKVLMEEMGGTLFTVAKDVKLQVEFNPAQVKGYRLIGYENRTMAAEDFADDTRDGGEIGAGHSVTALYEVALAGSGQEIPEIPSRYGAEQESTVRGREPDGTAEIRSGELLAVNIRYKEPEGSRSRLLTFPVTIKEQTGEMSENMSWAAGVAQAGMLLKHSDYLGTTKLEEVRQRLESLGCVNGDGYREEFLYLLTHIQGSFSEETK